MGDVAGDICRPPSWLFDAARGHLPNQLASGRDAATHRKSGILRSQFRLISVRAKPAAISRRGGGGSRHYPGSSRALSLQRQSISQRARQRITTPSRFPQKTSERPPRPRRASAMEHDSLKLEAGSLPGRPTISKAISTRRGWFLRSLERIEILVGHAFRRLVSS